jgi:hypothetical protein
MAWSTTKCSKGDFWVMKSETLSVATTTDKDSTAFQVPPGQDFIVGVYHASTASNTVDLDVLWSVDNSTFVVGKADIVSNHTAAAVMNLANYDVSANGEAPFYKLRIDPDASVSDTTLSYVVYYAFHRRKLGQAYG